MLVVLAVILVLVVFDVLGVYVGFDWVGCVAENTVFGIYIYIPIKDLEYIKLCNRFELVVSVV